MNSVLYDAVAYGMRYWFLLLIALILFTLIAVSVSEYKRHKSVMNIVGNYIGYMEVISGDEASLGMRLGLTKETLVGSGSKADIVIDDEDVERSHAVIRQKESGVFISPVGNARLRVNGQIINGACRIYSGDMLSFGRIDAEVFFKEGTNDA